MKRIGLLLILLSFCGGLFAKNLEASMILDSIKAVEKGEQRGDEIYFSVSAFHGNGENEFYTVPSLFKDAKPTIYHGAHPASVATVPRVYWNSKSLPKIKDVELWSDDLKEGESVEIVVSVIEHDAPPWNPDDLVGTIKFLMKNDNNKLVIKQLQQGDKKPITVAQAPWEKKFIFDSEHGKYEFFTRIRA